MTAKTKAHTDSAQNVRFVAIDQIEGSPYNPRSGDDDTAAELAASLRQFGLLSPILLRPLGEKFELVAGHRRVTAARSLGWTEISAIVQELSPEDAATRLMEENLKRRDLKATEKARFLARYIEDFGVTQAEAGERFSMAQETVSNLLAILDVPPEIIQLVDEGRLTPTHVKVLLPLRERPKQMAQLARQAAASTPDDAPTPTRYLADTVRYKLNDIGRTAADKEKRERVKSEVGPKLAKRLTEGLEETGDKKLPYRDPASGLPVYFARVRLDGAIIRPVEPSFIDQRTYLHGQPGVQEAVAKELGVERHSVRGHDYQYAASAWLKQACGFKASQPCPCGGEHIAVRGWGVAKGDPILMSYYGDTSTKGKPETVVYCRDYKGVARAITKRMFEEKAAIEEREKQEAAALGAFLRDVAPQGGVAVAAFLVGCHGQSAKEAVAARHKEAEAWQLLCKGAANDLDAYYGRRSASVIDIIKAATGQPFSKKRARAADPEGEALGQEPLDEDEPEVGYEELEQAEDEE